MKSVLLKHPTFGRFMLGRLIATFSDQLLMFAIPLIIYKSTGSIAKSGMAFFIEWLPRVVSLPIAGSLSDRWGGVQVFKVSDLARGIACLSAFALLLFLDGDHVFWALSFLAAFTAFFYSQSFVSLESMVPKVLPKEELPQGQALLQACDQISTVAGPLVAGLVVHFLPRTYLIGVAGLLFLLSFTNLALLKFSDEFQKNAGPGLHQSRTSVLAGIRLGLWHLRSNPLLILLVLISSVINLLFGTVMALSPGISTGIFGVSDHVYGFVNSSTGLMSVLCLMCLPFLLRVMTIFRLSMVGLGILLLGAATLSFASNFPFFVFGFALIYGGVNLFNVYMRSERARLVPSTDLGRVIGVMVLLNQLSLPLAGLLVARFSGVFSPQTLLGYVALSSWIMIPILTFAFVYLAQLGAAKTGFRKEVQNA